MRSAVMVLLLAAVPLSGCTQEDVRAIAFEDIAQGGQSGYDADSFEMLVIRTQEQWETFWEEHQGIVEPVDAAPDVDFRRNFVVALFMGTQPTGGYAIDIQTVEVDGKSYVVRYDTVSPTEDCAVTQALTDPHHVVRIEIDDDVAPSAATVKAVLDDAIESCG